MSTLDSRGHEVVDPKPFEPVVPIRRQPSIADMVRAEIMRARAAADDEIRTEDDLVEDMTDFDLPSFEDDLIGPSPYEIDDDVPDKLPSAPKEEKAMPDVPATEKTPETAPEA